jgi:hypothetical protein
MLCHWLPPRRLQMAILSDGSYTVTSDGKGLYVRGVSNVRNIAVDGGGVVVMGTPGSAPPRMWRIDLSHPLPSDIGTSLGVITDSAETEIGAQWGTSNDGVMRPVSEIPVGATVEAAQIVVGFHINGAYHALQAGPQVWDHCFSDKPTVFGNGTSRGTIRHTSLNEWVIDLPPGSTGRLFDLHLGSANAVNRGLYSFSLHMVLKGE